jgi:hypothetical protein
MTRLVTAILAGDIQAVRMLITTEPDLPHMATYDGILPLQLAYSKGRSDIIVALLRASAADAQRISNFAQLLTDYVRELCDTVAFAGWLTGIEYKLWHILTTGMAVGDDHYQLAERLDTLADLRFLSERCHGWIRYTEDGPTYVPLKEWQHHFSVWQQRHKEP